MTHPSTLVWIDASEAIVVRWRDGQAHLERIESDVPAHHRATGHVRHDPGIRHGGGGAPQTAGEPHRIEHLDRFVGQVAKRLPPEGVLLILGPGSVRERLWRVLREKEHQAPARGVTCEPSSRLTDRQLIARLREVAGAETRRRTVGAYRWDEPPPHRPSGQAQLRPRRVTEKPPRRLDRDEP